MLAQAQICVYEMAMIKKMPDKTLAKLAMQAAVYYKESISLAERGSLGEILDKAWKNYMLYNKAMYTAAAQYKQACAEHVVCEAEQEGFGAYVARLDLSKKYVLCYAILYYTILYSNLLYYTLLYYTLTYYTILYYTILYYTILYYTIL